MSETTSPQKSEDLDLSNNAQEDFEQSNNWFEDFILKDGVVTIKKTGHTLSWDSKLWKDMATWSSYYFSLQAWRLWRRVSGRPKARVAFIPDEPRPWYQIWGVLQASGAKIVKDVNKADILFHFEDATIATTHAPAENPRARRVNFRCRNVAKSHVADCFKRVAGYDLGVDPLTYEGKMVEKAEVNAAHDGRVVEGPLKPEELVEGKVYQKLIDNTMERGLVEDLRPVIVGGEPKLLYIKRREVERRFKNENAEILLGEMKDYFSEDEIGIIRNFAYEIGMDWGGVDVLRDKKDGRIYIVDANKTDMGPPVAMPLWVKLRTTRRLARYFLMAFADPH